jgi:hypothetical protein
MGDKEPLWVKPGGQGNGITPNPCGPSTYIHNVCRLTQFSVFKSFCNPFIYK